MTAICAAGGGGGGGAAAAAAADPMAAAGDRTLFSKPKQSLYVPHFA